MDELEIDGKKYLSSRRAAKENRYHTDYIGQLIRAGKIAGKKVGRAWYVEEGSLNSYLRAESGKEPEPQVAVAPAPQPAESQAPDKIVEEEKIETVSKIVEERVIPEQRIHITLAEKSIPQKKNTLTYIEDTEPLLPALEGRHRLNADFVPVSHPQTTDEPEEMYSENEAEEVAEAAEETSPKIRKIFSRRRVAVLAGVALLIMVAAAGGSAWVATSIEVFDGKPASVGFTLK